MPPLAFVVQPLIASFVRFIGSLLLSIDGRSSRKSASNSAASAVIRRPIRPTTVPCCADSGYAFRSLMTVSHTERPSDGTFAEQPVPRQFVGFLRRIRGHWLCACE